MLYRIVALCLVFSVCAQDDAISTGMAKGAAQLAAAGKTEKAKEMLFQALANDANNPLALLELSKLASDGAGDYCWRAYQAADKKDAQLLRDIQRQMSKCNPAGAKMVQALEAHATALAEIGRRYSDEFTTAELAERGVESTSKPKVVALTKENVPGIYKFPQPGFSGEIELFADGTHTNTKGVKKGEYRWEIKDGELLVHFVTDTFTFALKPDGSLVEKDGGWKIERIAKLAVAKPKGLPGLTKENVVGVYKYNHPRDTGEIQIFSDGLHNGINGEKPKKYVWLIEHDELVLEWGSHAETFQLQPDGSLKEKDQGWTLIRKEPKR